MAGLLTKAFRIINPFDEYTVKSSRDNPGGLLNPNNTPAQSQPQNTPAQGDQYADPYGDYQYKNPYPGPQGLAGSRTSGGSAPAATGRQSLGYWQGREYYDPAELYKEQASYLDNIYGGNLSTMRQGKERQLGEYGRQKTSLSDQLSEIMGGYDKQEQQGLANINGYYGGLGDLYQSSQGARENELRSEVGTARQNTSRQAQESSSALERAIADYISNYDAGERDLATQYSASRDDIANSINGDLGNLGVRQILGQGVNTNLGASQINSGNALMSQLQNMQAGATNRNNIGSPASLNPILAYLAGLPLGS